MGVIKRQGIKYSIVVYAGAFIGMLNVLYFYPKFLSEEELGITKFLIDTASLMAPFLLFGAPNVATRFFPQLKDQEKKHHGFFGFLLTYAGISILLASLLYLIFRAEIVAYYSARDPLFRDYIYALWLVCIIYALSTLIQRYSFNYRRIVLPTLIHDYTFKIGTPLLAGFYFFEIASLDQFIYGIIALFVVDLTGQLLYLKSIGGLQFSPVGAVIKKVEFKKIMEFGSFGLLGSVGFSMIFFLDSFMVGTMYNLSGLGVFAIAAAIANVMNIPFKAFNKIGPPMIAEAWHNRDYEKIAVLYRRSSAVLLTLGLGVFILIWTNLDSLYSLMPNGERYMAGMSVVLILGLSRLIDLATGLNAAVIGYSKYFKFNFYSMSVLGLSNVALNYYLIPEYGIDGAATATLISFFLFNLVRYFFIYWRFGFQPFDLNTLKLSVVGLGLIFFGGWMPGSGNVWLDMVWQSLLFGGVFLLVVLTTNWSPDIRQLVVDFWRKIF